MSQTLDYSALALAGVAQAAALVHRTAQGEALPDGPRRALLATIATRNAPDLASVFPDPAAFRIGVDMATQALSGSARQPQVLHYSLQLIELARLLGRVPQVVEKLGRLLDQLDGHTPDDAELGQIYQQTISTLGKRIQVTGDPQVLQQEGTANRIRAMLLAGVRLAWLWQQLGGRRWHLVLRRRALLVGLRALATDHPTINQDP